MYIFCSKTEPCSGGFISVVCFPFILLYHRHEFPFEENSPLRRNMLLSVCGLGVCKVLVCAVSGCMVLCAAWLASTNRHVEHVAHDLDPCF